jgi:hypothetical protein
MALSGGILDLGCTTLGIQGTLIVGAGQISRAAPVTMAPQVLSTAVLETSVLAAVGTMPIALFGAAALS